jgi:hypothetical protein
MTTALRFFLFFAGKRICGRLFTASCSACPLAGCYDLRGKQEKLVLVDAFPFLPVTVTQQLRQLMLHARQELVLVLHRLQQLQHDLLQNIHFRRQVVRVDLHWTYRFCSRSCCSSSTTRSTHSPVSSRKRL